MISETQWQSDMFDGLVLARNRFGLSQTEVQNLVDCVKKPIDEKEMNRDTAIRLAKGGHFS